MPEAQKPKNPPSARGSLCPACCLISLSYPCLWRRLRPSLSSRAQATEGPWEVSFVPTGIPSSRSAASPALLPGCSGSHRWKDPPGLQRAQGWAGGHVDPTRETAGPTEVWRPAHSLHPGGPDGSQVLQRPLGAKNTNIGPPNCTALGSLQQVPLGLLIACKRSVVGTVYHRRS